MGNIFKRQILTQFCLTQLTAIAGIYELRYACNFWILFYNMNPSPGLYVKPSTQGRELHPVRSFMSKLNLFGDIMCDLLAEM